jgi:hypothetical protein
VGKRNRKDPPKVKVILDAKTLAAFRAFGRQGGSKGGAKGGQARAENLSKTRRQQIARDAAKARWKADKAIKQHAAEQEARRPSA